MERLTPRDQNAYPVKRTIMETGESTRLQKSREERMAALVRRHTERKNKPNPGIENARPQAGGRSSLTEKYKHNKELQKLAEELDKAISGNAPAVTGYMEKLFQLVGTGKVSDNQAYQFAQDVNPRISEKNFSEGDSGKELAQDVEAIVAQRKAKGLSAEQVQASRAAMETAFGRKLSEEEFRRAIYGERMTDTSERAKSFESQMALIEEVAGNEERFDSFIKSLRNLDGDTIKRVLSEKGGEVVLEVLLGDISENREEFITKFKKELGGRPEELRATLSLLAREIEAQEKKERPKIDPERKRLAKEAAEKWLAEQKQKRQVTAEEMDALFNNAERGIPPISGGADNYEVGLGLLESIDEVPEEFNEAFRNVREQLVDDERIALLAQDIYGNDLGKIQQELETFRTMRHIDDPQLFKQRYKQFLNNLLTRYRESMNDPEREKERAQAQAAGKVLSETGEVTKGAKSFNIKGLDEIVNSISPQRPGERSFFEREPRNIEEVAAWIMAGDDRSVWGPDGVYPIFKLSNEINTDTGGRKAEFHAENLIRWLRNKALEHHGDNPNDPLNLLQGVAIETLYKSISILTMKYNKQKYFADENGKPLSNLADEVINEAWLFGVRRNKNLGYIQAMNSDEKLFEAIVEMSGKNDHTGGRNLMSHFMMGENFSDEEGNKDNMVGDAMLAANHIYRNLSDIEKLRQMMPSDSPLFTLEGFKNASRVLNGQGFDEDTGGFGNLKIEGNKVYFLDPRTKVRTEIFSPDGKLVSNKNLVKFLNFFPEATPQETNEAFVRELVKQSIAGLVGFETGAKREEYEAFVKERRDKLGQDYEVSIEEYRKLKRMNLEWAETNSWVEQRWNGAAARNDTGYRGYDAWTKMYAQYYRERQSGSRTAGPIGNPHDLQIFRLLTPDMWLAIRTESGESVHEVFEELHMANLQLYKLKGELTSEQKQQKERLEKRKQEAYAKLRFPRWTESDWASNGVNRQAQVWHNIMNTEDLKFNELVKVDNWGVPRYDRQKFEEVVKDDFIKKRRYAFSSNNAMNYGAVTRMRVRSKEADAIDGFKFKDMYLAEAMFGDVVIDSIRRDFFEGRLEYDSADENGTAIKKHGVKKGEKFDPKKHGSFQEYLNSAQARERLLKNICRAGLAAQIKAHRERSGTTERWNSEIIRKMYQSLRSMPEYQEDPLTGEEVKRESSQFFSEEDIKWIREQTGTSKAQLLWEDAYHAGWDTFAGAFPDILKMFYDDIIS